MKAELRYIFLCLLLVCNVGWSQNFITKVSAKVIGKNDLLQVQYVAENIDLSDFVLPKFPGWIVHSGPDFSSSRVQSGTLVKQQIIYSMVLQPTRAGKLSVPSATITIDRHNSRQSNTVTIDVKPTDHIAGNQQSANAPQVSPGDPAREEEPLIQDQVLRKGENPIQKIKNNLLVKLDLDKTSAYVGEPIIATYKLCTRLRSQSRVVKQPEFSGCTVTELTTDQTVAKRERINGRMYNVYVIRRVQLIPLQPGQLQLPQASVENNVGFFKEEDINYRDLFYNPSAGSAVEQQVTLSNAVSAVNIKPLPTGSPDLFDGAVGKFSIGTSKLDKSVPTNNNAKFIVVVDGTGSLQQIKPPPIQWPAGIEAFEPVETEEVDKTVSPLRVRKIFTYLFVVSKTGSYTIPAISFCYFNPASNHYEVINSKPVLFEAKKGRMISLPTSHFLINSDFQMRLYILIIVGFVAVVGGLYWFNKKQSAKPAIPVKPIEPAVAAPSIEKNTTQFIQYIRQLNPIKDTQFYKQLRRYIISFLTTKYGVTEDEVSALAARYPAEKFTLDEAEILLKNCSLGMYTPVFDAEEAMKHRLLAIELLSRLERAEL